LVSARRGNRVLQNCGGKEKMMRIGMTAALAAMAIAAAVATAAAAPSEGNAGHQNAAPFTRLAQGNDYGGYTYGWGWSYGFNYIPACPVNYHYSCWQDPYGYRRCGCLPYRHW
jgi:hypothetical protein